MSHVMTLVASTGNLSIAHLEKLEKFVEDHGIGLIGKPSWLDPHIAADMPVQNAVTIEQMKALRALFAEDRIDILCVEAEHRQKKLLLADMDSTIVETETLDELAGKAGIKDRIAAITARAMNGELDFKSALRERVGLLKGLPLSALQETLDETDFCEGAEHLIRTMRKNGAICVLVSGGFTFFTGAVAQKAGFHHHHGNTLDDDGAMLLGTVSGDILDKNSKLSYLKSYTQELGLDLNQTLAIGDGANDLPMLASAGLGIGYRPKPILAETLLNILQFADLRGVLYAQGFKNIC
ncbi:MAG TPA: phosphoserine phosphatase SerB [Micavibrio sp.]|nr:phosphoserine phosphatase SerB [Micavibrio sp.]